MYDVHEYGANAADAEIRRLSPVGFRTWKLSSRADGSWGSRPCESRTLPGKQTSSFMNWFFCVFISKEMKSKKYVAFRFGNGCRSDNPLEILCGLIYSIFGEVLQSAY